MIARSDVECGHEGWDTAEVWAEADDGYRYTRVLVGQRSAPTWHFMEQVEPLAALLAQAVERASALATSDLVEAYPFTPAG